MRHGKKFNHLSRKSPHRKAMLANMAASLIMHKRIKTTVAKAKALRIYVEPLITRSKDDSTHSRRVVFSYLQSKEAVTELFREISQKVANRPGGYTRILKTGNRLGDNAEMCYIELVDYNENLLKDAAAKPKASRRRRGGKKTTAVAVTDVAIEETTDEVVAEETTDEVKESASAEAPADEEVVEETKEEVPKAEEKAEEPVAEKKEEEPKAEEKNAEEPKAEESSSADAPADEEETKE